MPTLPSTQTQSANGAPLYVPTDGDGNAVVSGSIVAQGGINAGTYVAAPALTVVAAADGTSRALTYNGQPTHDASVSYDGFNLSLDVDGVTGLEVQRGGGALAPVSMASPRFVNTSTTQSISFVEFGVATGLSQNNEIVVATLDVSALSNFRTLGFLLNKTPITPTTGNWIEGSGSGETPGGSLGTVKVNYMTGLNPFISSVAPLPQYGQAYGIVNGAVPTYATIAYPANGELYVSFTCNFTTLPQTVIPHLDITVFGIL